MEKSWALTTRDFQGNVVFISYHKREDLAARAFRRRRKLRLNEPLFVERNFRHQMLTS